MVSKYFQVEVKPTIPATTSGLHLVYVSGEVLFDWTSFEVPRGGGRLIGATVEIRPKGDAGSTPNIFPLDLLFAKSKTLTTAAGVVTQNTAPSTLGAEGANAVAPTDISLQTDTYIGKMAIVAGDYSSTDSLAVASAAAPAGLLLYGQPETVSNVGVDTLYVGGIAKDAFSFISSTEIDNGDLNGPTMTVSGTDPRLFIAPGDTIAACDATGTSVQIAMGEVATMAADSIVLTEAFATGDVADADIIYNVNPIKIMLNFEK